MDWGRLWKPLGLPDWSKMMGSWPQGPRSCSSQPRRQEISDFRWFMGAMCVDQSVGSWEGPKSWFVTYTYTELIHEIHGFIPLQTPILDLCGHRVCANPWIHSISFNAYINKNKSFPHSTWVNDCVRHIRSVLRDSSQGPKTELLAGA